MEFRYVFGSLKAPPKDNAQGFLDCISKVGTEDGSVRVTGCIIAEGPGCCNYGMLIEAPDEKAADHLGRAIMNQLEPGKWASATPDPRLTPGTFKDLR